MSRVNIGADALCMGTFGGVCRHPSEISSDIANLRARISALKERVNFRFAIESMLDSYAYGSPEAWISALTLMLGESGEALESLKALSREIDTLFLELEDTRCKLQG